MFDNGRYMTRGFQQEIPLELQLFLFDCVDKLKATGTEMDYLQVFELTKEYIHDIELLKVEHRQEVPEYKKEYLMVPVGIEDAKVFIIDSGEYTMAMLAQEY